MDIRKDQRGFSLVELIITMAIMAVFAGAIIGGMTYLNAGKTKKASAKLNNEISSIQTATMTKKGETYLYLYRTNDGVFSSIVSSTYDADNDGTPDFPDGFMNRADLNTYLTNGGSQTKICDSTVSIKGKVGTGTGEESNSAVISLLSRRRWCSLLFLLDWLLRFFRFPHAKLGDACNMTGFRPHPRDRAIAHFTV